MTKLKDYSFEAYKWPPPKEMQTRDTYLFGFDEEKQPYILKWESINGSQGWCACTLEDSQVDHRVTAVPRFLEPRDVVRRITRWAAAPLLKYVAKQYT